MAQLDLFGALAPRSLPLIAYFALRPDRETAWSIESRTRLFQRRHSLVGRPYPADRLHVSLCAVGFRKGDIQAAIEAASHVRLCPFPVMFDTISTFGGGTCLVLRSSHHIEAIGNLRDQLRSLLVGSAISPGRSSYAPHVTLLRPVSRMPDRRLERPIGWVARDFVLAFEGRGRDWDLGRWAFG